MLANKSASQTKEEHNAIQVECKKLSLSIKITKGNLWNKTKKTKGILYDISATFKPGRLTAIMGASGSGKTSLLSILAGDIPKNGAVGGQMLLNGLVCDGRGMKRLSGFVFQDDVLFDTMTVRECLTMSAMLRLPDSVPKAQKLERVEEIINILGLEKAADIQIGKPEKKGISGGERKRTAIGMEMITNPQMLFLDEPTSGLDTFTAFNVVSKLKDLVDVGKTVVATIHQPSSKTFMLFDDLLLLAAGRVIYHGPVSVVLEYFCTLGFICPSYMNPADFIFMEVINYNFGTATSSAESVAEDEEAMGSSSPDQALIAAWNKHVDAEQNNGLVSEIQTSNLNISPVVTSQKTTASAMSQFKVLCDRVARNMIRNKMVLVARICRSIALGLLISAIYYGLRSKEGVAQIQDRTSVLFFLCTNEFFFGSGNAVFLFSAEKAVFLREYHNGFYTVIPYFLAKTLLELPLSLLSPFITVAIMYPLTGLRSSLSSFLIIVAASQLISLVGSALGLLLGALFTNFEMAMSLMPAITLPMMVFGGVQLNLDNIPFYLRFMPYLSPLKWGFTAMAVAEFKGLVFPNPVPPGAPPSGDAALQIYGWDRSPSVFFDFSVLLLMYAAFTLSGIFCLWRSTRK